MTQLDRSTEEKIKSAAQKLFTQKGFAATKTRDIAAEAGINTALLNYYFRSKEKLFDLIMIENLQEFLAGIFMVINDKDTSLEQKLEEVASMYIDKFLVQPDIPLFILNEVRNDPTRIIALMQEKINIKDSYLVVQIMEAKLAGKLSISNPLHLLANMMGMLVFPFIAKPLFQHLLKVDEEQYRAFLIERKRLIPKWIKACFTPD